MPIEQKEYGDDKPLCFRRKANDFQPSFQQGNKHCNLFQSFKGDMSSSQKAGLGVREKSPLPLWAPNMVYEHIWDFPWPKQDETADGSTWTWVEVQDREQHSAELPFSKGEGRTAAPRQQESVTTFRHSPRQETAPDGTRSLKVKSKQLAISDFAKLGQDCRARYFLISHRKSRTISGKHDSVESVQTAKKMLQQFFFFFFLSLSMIFTLIS